MFFIVYAFKGQVHVFVGQVKIVGHSSCRTSAILEYFCPLVVSNNTCVVTYDCRSSSRRAYRRNSRDRIREEVRHQIRKEKVTEMRKQNVSSQV